MKNKDCKNCLFVGSISAKTKAVFCSLNKEVAKMTCKDYTAKDDLPTWEQITRKNEVQQISMSFGNLETVEQLPNKKESIKAYVQEMKKANAIAKEIKKDLTDKQKDYFGYGIQ